MISNLSIEIVVDNGEVVKQVAVITDIMKSLTTELEKLEDSKSKVNIGFKTKE